MHAPATRTGFGLWTLVALVVGNAIGAGVYTTSGFALADLGSREAVLAAWAVGGLVALAGAASYGMLAQRLTESGGEYLYLTRALHPVAGSIAGWVSLLAGFTGAIAFSATALETYARAALDGLQSVPPNSIALGVVLAAGFGNAAQSRADAAAHNLITGLMVGGIAFFLLWAGLDFATTGWPHAGPPPAARFSAAAFAGSLVWISLSYSGFNAAVYVAGEARDPARAVPRAMLIGTALTALLYLGLNAVFLYAPEADTITGKPEVAAIAAQAIGGTAARRALEAVIALSLLTSVTAMVLAGPRVYAKMAENGALPRLFAGPSGRPPRAAILLQVLLACAVILAADIRGLLGWLGLTLSLSAALAVSTLFVARDKPRSALFPLAPVIFVGATLLFGALAAWREPAQFVATAATIGAGAAAYAIRRR